MNILLWVLQVLFALHTGIGAIWKFSHSAEQTMPTLKSIPHGLWLSLGIIELLCALALMLPALNKSFGILIPIASVLIAFEMLAFSTLHVYSGAPDHGPMIYWLIVAAFCAFIAYGRLVLSPIG